MKKKFWPIFFNWALVIVWLVLIFISSSTSDFSAVTGTTKPSTLVSDLAHVVIYAILTWWLIRALLSSGVSRGKAFFVGFLVAVLYGATDEFHQSFVAGREMRLGDWLLDLASAYFVLSLHTYRYRRRK